MKARYHQLIATSLATCLTICQIPAWAQAQGQRPKILASECSKGLEEANAAAAEIGVRYQF